MRVAVTGAAGYLGSNLVHELVAQGHEVVGIDRVASAIAPTERVTWVAADVLDADAMTEALADIEVVYHLVAVITLKREDPAAWRINTEGVGAVADAALRAGVRRLVHCSSVHSSDQAHCGAVLTEESPRSEDGSDRPVYDRSKYAGEIELLRRVDRGLDAVICNPTGIYGGRDHRSRLSRLNRIVYDAARGRVPLSVGSGFDLVDVRDVAHGLTLAAATGRTGENYLLPGHPVSMHDLMSTAARVAGRRGPLVPVPLWMLRAILPVAGPIAALAGSDVMSPAALGSLLANPTVSGVKARAELGYDVRPPEETITDLVVDLLG